MKGMFRKLLMSFNLLDSGACSKSGSSPWLNRLAPPERKQNDKEGRGSLSRTTSGEQVVEKAQIVDESLSEMLKGIYRRDFDVFE